MDFYKLHSKPEKLLGHHEADDIVPMRIQKQLDDLKPLNKRQIEMLSKKPDNAYFYARYYGRPFKQGEDAISKSAKYAFWYAYRILQKPWPRGEDAISKSAFFSVEYASNVLKKPWPKGEDVIASDPQEAYRYSEIVIRGPWPKGEEAIATDVHCAISYAKRVLRKRFLKAEKLIKNSDYKDGYEEHFKVKL